MGRRIFAGFFCLFFMMMLCSCAMQERKTEKIRDLEYTVVSERELPEALLCKIEEQKDEEMKLTYLDGEYLYIIKGYGMQETGGYSIAVKELYLTETAVYIATDFHGPKKGEKVTLDASFPYIAIKTEKLDYPVIFE